MKPVQFLENSYGDYIECAKVNKEIFEKISTLILDINRDFLKVSANQNRSKKTCRAFGPEEFMMSTD